MPTAADPPFGLPMSIVIEDDKLVVRLSGEIDVSNAEALPSALMAAASETDASVIVDIAEVSFVDSSFLRSIVICEQRLGGEGVPVKVRNANDQARRVFEITQLAHLLAD